MLVLDPRFASYASRRGLGQRWRPWIIGVCCMVLASAGPAAAAPAKAARGIATFVHGAEAAAPGGELPLVLVVYGFSQLTEAAPLPGARVELAWDTTNLDPNEVAARTKPVVVTSDAQGAALCTVTAPHGLGPWKLLVRTSFDDKERTDEIAVARAEAETVRLSQSVERARAGDAVHAWVEVDVGMRPAAGERVRFEVLEGEVAVQTVWRTTDASGRADTELRLPKGDALLSGWKIAATTERGSTAQNRLPLRDDTPTEAFLQFDEVAAPPRPGGALTVVGRVRDATGNPVPGAEIETWGGPANLAVAIDDPRWNKLASKARTDAAGRFQLHATMPSLIGRAGITWLTRAVATIGGERIRADHTTAVARSTHSLRLLPAASGLLPGFRNALVLIADDSNGNAVPHVDFRLEADGLRQSVRSNERGEALLEWNVPIGIGTTRHVEPCSGEVAANVAIVAEPSALAAGFPARSDLCVPVDRDSHYRVVVDPPIARAGEPVRVTVQESQRGKLAGTSARSFSLVARLHQTTDAGAGVSRTALASGKTTSLSTAGLAAGIYTVSAIGVSARTGKNDARADAPALGYFLVVPKRLPRPQVALRSREHLPSGRASIDVRLLDEHGAPFAGTVGAIVTEKRFDAQEGALYTDIRRRYCVNGSSHDALRCDDAVSAASDRQKLAPAYLAAVSGRPLEARQDPLRSARGDADKTFAEVVRSLEGAIFEASGSRDSLQDVLRKEGGKNRFNPELLTLAVQALPEPPRTPGGAPVALADLVSLDPQVDYDHVARRVARYKLFLLLEALRTARDGADPGDLAFDEPNASLRRLLAAGTIEESALIDPWGGAMAFVRVPQGTAPDFLTPKRGYALHAPGPDGRLGTADDVKSPFERVLRSGSPYAKATGEDKVVDAQYELSVAQSTVDAWRSILDDATGTALGSGTGIGLGGVGTMGHGSGHGSVRSGEPRLHPVRVGAGSGFRALVAPRAVAADGSLRIEVPLGADEGTYRVLLVADVPGLGRLFEHVDVPVELKRSLRVKTGERWVVGDQGDVAVIVENRDATAAALEVRAEETSSNVTVRAPRKVAVTVPARGQVVVKLRVGTPRAGAARLRLALSEQGRVVDRFEGSWQVMPAGEPVALAEAAWVRSSAEIPRPAAVGHIDNGVQVLSLQQNGNDVLRAALLSVEPARLRERKQAEDARLLAMAVRHYADAQSDKALATLSDTVQERALGRASILPATAAGPKAEARDGCPSIPLHRLFRDDPAGAPAVAAAKKPSASVFAGFEASVECFDTQINQRVEELLAKGDAVDLARAVLELAEHAPREPLSVALTLELRKRVKLTPSGRMTPPDRHDHVDRTIVLAALLRGAHTATRTSKIDAAALVPWLLVEQDAHGSFGSVEATAAAVRALVASGAMVHAGKTQVQLETSVGTRKLDLPASGVVAVPLPADAGAIKISVKGAPVLARIVAPTLRSYRSPPLPSTTAPDVRVDWPEDARVERAARLSIRVAPRGSNVAAELRVPLPPNVELASRPSGGARLVDHVLRIPVSKVGIAMQLPLRVLHGGRFTVAEGGLYEGGERQSVVPARTFTAR